MGKKTELSTSQRGLLWAVIILGSLTMLVLGIVLTIRAVKKTTELDARPDVNEGQEGNTERSTSKPGVVTTPWSSTISGMSPTEAMPKSEFAQYRHAAVAADAIPCAAIGNEILAKYRGSAVDAAIASMLCVGVVNMHSNGIGGGHLMTIYDTPRGGSKRVFNTILGRERAPAAATEDMFVNGTASSIIGGKAIGIPGEIKGFHHAWTKFGRLPWKMLVEPTIELCKRGVTINRDAAHWAKIYEQQIKDTPAIRELLIKEDGTIVEEGDTVIMLELARTLSIIADDPTAYYDPTKQLAQDIVADIQDAGGIITLEDLANYTVYDMEPLAVHLNGGNYTVYGPGPPAGAVILQYILNILDGYLMNEDNIADTESKVLTYHRIAEAFKYAYAKRTELADQNFVDIKELIENLTSKGFAEDTRQKIDDDATYAYDHYEPDFALEENDGTSHLNVLGPDGSAVAVTSTINYLFGSFVRGSRTGIIFNDEMDDFSTPGLINAFGFRPSPSNFIKPGKMPQSSMSPIIVVDGAGDVVYISGGSGGSRITTAVTYVAIHALWLGMPINQATDLPRLHHQLLPNLLEYGVGFDLSVREGLAAKGHNLTESRWVHVQSIHNRCENSYSEQYYDKAQCIDAVVDFRKAGKPDGY